MIPVADRMARIQPFHVMELLARTRELEAAGRSIIHMEIGEPDFDTPQPIVQAGLAALSAGRTRYTPAKGVQALREAIAGHYATACGTRLDADRVIVTPGSSGALQLVLSVLINPGDEVLLADPGYPCNRHFVELVDGKPVAIPVGPETAYQPTAQQVEQAWRPRTKAVLLASPSNPTGTLLSLTELAELHAVVSGLGGALIVDEIYQGLVYDTDPTTALAVAEDLFVVNSFSKYFGMTGWRLGWLVAPLAFIEPLDRLAQNIYLSAPTLSQYAALDAFSPQVLSILEQRRLEFRQRRDFLLPALRGLGFDIPLTPQGAFYLYAGCGGICDDSYAFAHRLLQEAGVAVTPGRDFGFHQPETHLRFAYTTTLTRLQQGVERIARFLR